MQATQEASQKPVSNGLRYIKSQHGITNLLLIVKLI